MKRTEELERKLDALLEEFSDLSCEDIADILEYRTTEYQRKVNRRCIILALIFMLVITCGIQQCIIQEYEQSDKEWVEFSKFLREKLDTCMNRNERIYEQLYEFQDIRIKQLKGELPK